MKPDEQRARELTEKYNVSGTTMPLYSVWEMLREAILDERARCTEIVQTKLHNINSDLADLVAAAIEKHWPRKVDSPSCVLTTEGSIIAALLEAIADTRADERAKCAEKCEQQPWVNALTFGKLLRGETDGDV